MDNDFMICSGWSMLDDSSHIFKSQETNFKDNSFADKDGKEHADCGTSSSFDMVLERIAMEKEASSYLCADLRLTNMELLRNMEEAKSQLNFLREMLSNLKDEIRSLAKENGLQHMAITGRVFGHLDHASKISQLK